MKGLRPGDRGGCNTKGIFLRKYRDMNLLPCFDVGDSVLKFISYIYIYIYMYRIFSNLICTSFCRFLKGKKVIIHLYTNKIALYFTLLKQHIKIVVLFKSPNNSPTCFGQFLTILREIFIFFTSVTKDKLFRFV